MMFPCIDEPQVKSIFKLIIETERKYNVYSNMPEERIASIDKDRIRVEFMNTPLCST